MEQERSSVVTVKLLWKLHQTKLMQKARDFTKPLMLLSASTYTLMNAGRNAKADNSKNVHVMETSKTSLWGQGSKKRVYT